MRFGGGGEFCFIDFSFLVCLEMDHKEKDASQASKEVTLTHAHHSPTCGTDEQIN